jgi:polar amino acid transport system substrate-binding protein
MRRMTKSITLTAVLLSLSPIIQAATWDGIEKKHEIRLATEGVFAPFNFKKGAELTGFEVDLATEIAKKLGLKYTWKTTPFESLLIGLNQDRYDLVAASHGITEERAKAVDFTHPHYCTGGVIVSLAGGPKTAADLKGKVVAVQVGSSYLENVKKVTGVKQAKTYPRDTDSMQNLIGGRADAWVTDKFVALDAIKANPKAKMEMGEMLFQEKVAMALSKGNSGLLAKVNEALDSLQKDGTYKKISQKYFSQDISCR